MLNWCAGILTALAVYSLAKDRLSPHAALLAASAFYLCPWLFHFSSCARVDIWVCFFATVALLEGWCATDDGDRRSWIRCGLAVGAAMSTKFSGAAIVGLPLAIALLVHSRVPTIARLGIVFIFFGTAVLAFSPWLIKSGLWTANPVYPFLQHFFHSPFWDAARDKVFFAEHSPSFSWWDERGFRYQLESVPSAVAVFAWPIPLLVLWPKFWKRFSFAIMWAGLAIGIWLVTMIPVWRYAFPVFAVFPLLAALIFRECESTSRNRWLVRTSFLVFALWALFGQTIRKSTENIANHDNYPPKSNSWTFLFNSATGPPLVEQMFPSINWMNQNLPLSSRVLFMTEEQIYYARHLPDYSTSFGECWVSKLAENCKDADEFAEGVRRRGITHIYLSVGFGLREERNGYMRGFDWDLFHQFLNRHTRPIQPQFDNHIYEILPAANQKDSLTNP
jgi:4-amino-4-deoxy-L-arabinose transferase-like glycosyltransferase